MQLAVHSCSHLCLQREVAKLASSTVIYCVTITWPQIFKGSLQVTVVLVGVLLLMVVTVERIYLGK